MSLEQIEQKIQSRCLVQHMFLEWFAAGRYSKEKMAVWLSQQFYIAMQFPRCLAALYARIEDGKVSTPLIEAIENEHWSTPSLLEGALPFFSLSIDVLCEQEPLKLTKDFLNFRIKYCLGRVEEEITDVEEVLGAIALAHEFVDADIFKALHKGVEQLPGVTSETLQYFAAGVEDRPQNYQVLKTIMERHATSEEALKRMEFGAFRMLGVRSIFFDLMHATLNR